MKIGLFFGSFNPIHVGHVILANHILEFSTLENLWFVVTPQSPFKKKQSLISNYTRIEMVEMAIKNYPKMKSCNIEFSMKQPAYTVDTLAVLREKYPKHQFDLIMGEDNLVGFTKWKNYQEILENHDLWVYPRPGHLAKDFNHPLPLKNLQKK
ncbi:MAG: nicotinic acid mononucleotide adenylyltransferase [Flavobacteriaceae bacterium]|nr:MAG: nicotinic acid mononucleotide adenylyltransferase [Flavobacteriaceae bacterium]